MCSPIAKRYAKAIFDTNGGQVDGVLAILRTLTSAFAVEKTVNLIESPTLSKEQKLKFMDSLLDSKDKKTENLLKLLVEKNRLSLIPDIYCAVQKLDAQNRGVYEGYVFGESVDEESIARLSSGLSSRFGVQVSLKSKASEYDGIKAVVDELGVEVGFSRSRLKSDLTEHILKAI